MTRTLSLANPPVQTTPHWYPLHGPIKRNPVRHGPIYGYLYGYGYVCIPTWHQYHQEYLTLWQCVESPPIAVSVIRCEPCHWNRQFCAVHRFRLDSTHRSRLDSTRWFRFNSNCHFRLDSTHRSWLDLTPRFIWLLAWYDSWLDSNLELIQLLTLFDPWLDLTPDLVQLPTWFDLPFLAGFCLAFLSDLTLLNQLFYSIRLTFKAFFQFESHHSIPISVSLQGIPHWSGYLQNNPTFKSWNIP